MKSAHYSIELPLKERLLERSRFPSRPAYIRDPQIFVGLDLGQVHDPTAIAILERTDVVLERSPVTFAYNTETRHAIRYLERVALGTPYPDVVEHVRDLVRRPELNGATLILDATGVGKPVLDMFRQAKLPCRIVPVTITGGDRQTSEFEHWRVPKRDLITGLMVLFQNEKLQICGHLAEAETLVRELGGMRVKISLDGNDKYGAWREGEHDDLVLAAALACWRSSWRG